MRMHQDRRSSQHPPRSPQLQMINVNVPPSTLLRPRPPLPSKVRKDHRAEEQGSSGAVVQLANINAKSQLFDECRYSTPPAPPPGRSRRAVGLTALLTVRRAAPNSSTQYSLHGTWCEPDARCPVRLSADHARTRTYILPRNALGPSCFVDGVVETITVRVLGAWCHALPSHILLGSLSERRLARWSLSSMHGSPTTHHSRPPERSCKYV